MKRRAFFLSPLALLPAFSAATPAKRWRFAQFGTTTIAFPAGAYWAEYQESPVRWWASEGPSTEVRPGDAQPSRLSSSQGAPLERRPSE